MWLRFFKNTLFTAAGAAPMFGFGSTIMQEVPSPLNGMKFNFTINGILATSLAASGSQHYVVHIAGTLLGSVLCILLNKVVPEKDPKMRMIKASFVVSSGCLFLGSLVSNLEDYLDRLNAQPQAAAPRNVPG